MLCVVELNYPEEPKMDLKQLNSVSPLRVFEDSINGGLGKGNLGVIVSKKGVGKTACLVHIATDKLFKGEHVIHVSPATWNMSSIGIKKSTGKLSTTTPSTMQTKYMSRFSPTEL